jgi:hypothetical protein
MDNIAIINARENDIDRFLYANVGDDKNGNTVSVLSTLARLGLDPWKEASDLANLSIEKARRRLSALLSGFRDVPALAIDNGATVERLIRLLPERSYHSLRGATPSDSRGLPISSGTIFAALMILLIVVQIFGFGIGR